MDKLEEQLTKEKLHDNDFNTALIALMTPFQRFFRFKWPMYTTFKTRDDFQKYMGKNTQIFKDIMIHDIDVIEMYLIEEILHEHEIEKILKLQSKDVHINLVQALDASLVVTKSSETESKNSSSETIFSKSMNERQMQMQEGNVDTVKALDASLVVTESCGT
ncbi:hypothetical protein Tco_0414092 [Tanacetum coccineum]